MTVVKLYACFSTMAIEGRTLYFFEKETNEIYYYNIENQEEKRICTFADERFKKPYCWGNTHIYKDNVVFVPRAGAEILVINIRTGKSEIIDATVTSEREKYISNFIFSKVIQDTLYLVGAAFPGIIEVDLKSYDIKQVKCKEVYNEQEKPEAESIFSRGVMYEDGYFIIPLTYKNQICFYDPVQRRVVKQQDVPWKGVGFSGVCKSGDEYWLTSRKDNIVLCLDKKWNKKESIAMQYDLNTLGRLLGCFTFGDKPLFYTENGCKLWRIDKNKMDFVPFITEEFLSYESNMVCSNHVLYVYDEIRHHLMAIEEDGKVTRSAVRIESSKSQMDLKRGICREENINDLISYMVAVCSE